MIYLRQSTRAFKVALDMAKKYQSKITLLTCLEGDAWHHKYYDSRADKELIKKQSTVTKKHIEKLESYAEKNQHYSPISNNYFKICCK